MVTMRDIAKAAGVSPASVSNAYNKPERLSAAQREHVLEVARSLGYPGPNAAGRSLRTGRVGAIGVMVTDALSYAFADAASVQLLQGIAAVGEARDVALTLLPFTGSNAHVETVASPIIHDAASTALRGVVDGFLAYAMPDGHPAVQAALLREQKLVVIDAPVLPDVPRVWIDDRAAARDGAKRVLADGHRRVGILVDRLAPDGVSGPVDAARRRAALDHVAGERLAGYLSACRAAGVASEDVHVVEAGGWRPQELRAAVTAVLEHDVTALLVTTDQLAFVALAELRARGLSVGKDVSVLGFDGVPQAEQDGLTTIEQPLIEKGERAMRMLLESIAGETPASAKLPTRFVARASTGPPPRR